MIVIETCPKCGCDLHEEVICTYPPIPRKACWNCGWSWTGEPEKIVRVPFGGNLYEDNTTTLAFEKSACINCPSNPKNGGDGICFCTLGQTNVVY